MIFDANTTGLGTGVGMAEGYDCSYGCALALVESARSDYQMFRAMLDIDAREMQIQRESAGYVAEGQITALAENTFTGIWEKIKELFKKLAEKIKAIWHSFAAKMNTLFMDDKKLIKKYEKELTRKTRVGKLEVKYLKTNETRVNELLKYIETDQTFEAGDWSDDSEKRMQHYCPNNSIKADNIAEDVRDYVEADEDEDTIDKAFGGIRSLMNNLKDYSKVMRKFEKGYRDLDKNCERKIKEFDKKAKDDLKTYNDTKNDSTKSSAEVSSAKNTADNASKVYDMCVAYTNVVLPVYNALINLGKDEYKYEKAALHKAITTSNDKIDEATYLDAVAEAAEQEVENVIGSALSKEELSKINNASLNVMDSDVSDDPNKLTYGPDYYTDNQSYVRTSGSIDTDIASRNETAFFGKLLY